MTKVISSEIEPAVRQLADRFQETGWAKELRLQALEAYDVLDLPKQDEGWRNLRLKEVPLDSLIPVGGKKETPEAVCSRIDSEAAGVIVHYNSDVTEIRLNPELEAKGVILTSLQNAIAEYPEKVEKYLGKLYTYKESKFAALHYALRTGGAFLYVPKNVVIDAPFQVFTYGDIPNVGIFNHTLIVAEAFSQITVLEYSGSDLQGGTNIHSGAVEIFPQDGAKITYISLQNFDLGTYSFHPRRALLGRDSEVKWVASEFGGKIARSENTSYVDGDGANSEAVVVFFGSNEQSLDVSASMIHQGRNTTSDIVAKGVMNDKAKTIWRGLGHILPGSKGSSTYQKENSLILSENAKGDAIPGLLIEETDVAGAGHAATVGRIDEAHLFYLQSRGIPLKQAQRMIVEGFFGSVTELIPLENVRAEVQSLVDRKLGW
ncbi:Fe-S cluster assembly protein SufD [Effusibacillus lacus]|uniref:Fe-S cluster assembly protein SufD n=1 Tax=Effusibacillus lacus TaxID=1348429 RepID=A0A292YR18_9BACL|nr:Fe-S cluster assembly protein SufD [Effusibacillus lacus]TCS76870.1 Fe-S cluster assembly protein SufD [Effusibacillus lacus]GAX91203.1 Fe-S cluster assembly protein SufD [Effusibacillus lacus]